MSEDTITGKLLSVGLGAWIQYERACKRTEILSEAYLTTPIAQLLNSHTGGRVISEFRHPVLAPLASGAGRKPTTDFVVCDHDDKVSIAIETKWVGRTSPSPKQILWDLMRLALIEQKFQAKCFFIMGGQKKKLMDLADRQGFKDLNRKGWAKPLLRFDKNVLNTVRLDSEDVFRRPMLKELYKQHQNTEFPTRLSTRRSEPLLKEPKQQDFEIFVWELASNKVQMMRPKNNRHFHQNKNLE